MLSRSSESLAWDNAKNANLRKERGIRFEDVVFHIERGDRLDILKHPNRDRYASQRIFIAARVLRVPGAVRRRPSSRSSGPRRSSEAVASTHRRWRTEAGAITFSRPPSLLWAAFFLSGEPQHRLVRASRALSGRRCRSVYRE